MSENESGFYKLQDDVQQAFLFRDQVKFLFGEGLSDDETIAAIKARRWDQNQSNKFVMAIKEALNQGKLSDDTAIGEIHNLKTERSYYRGILDDLCDRLQLWANGFERLKDVHIVKTSDSENLAIDNRRPCSFSRRVNVLLDDNPDEVLTVLDNDQMLAKIEKMYTDLTTANEFRDQVKALLYKDAGVDTSAISDEQIIKSIQYVLDSLQVHEDNLLNKLVDKATEAMTFRDQVMATLGNPDDAIARIKELTEIKAEIALGNIGKLSNLSYEFRSQIKQALYEGVRDKYPSIDEFPDDEAIAKIEELTEQSQLLSEIGDILNMANAQCFDHRRFKQEERIVVTGFRRLCDIHAALFKKRSEYEIYGSRIINDLLNSEDLQAQKQAYDRNEAIAKIEQLTGDKDREIERLNRCLSGIASFLNLPSDAKQPDICFAIMELKEDQGDDRKKLADLRHDLIVANKVIARLVGE